MNEIPVEPEHVAELSLAEFRCAPGDRVEHGLHVGRRTRDYAQYLGGCCLIFKGFLQLVLARLFGLEQPRVLDGDDGLVGEGLEQIDLPIGKVPRLRPHQYNCPDWATILGHRDGYNASVIHDPGNVTMLKFGILIDIWDFLDCGGENGACCGRRATGWYGILRSHGLSSFR